LTALPKFIPPEELFPPRLGTAWETHHGLGAWDADMTTWLCLSILEHYFGPAADLATLIARGEWLQGEGYKALYEEARRQKPRAAMALSWCFNEPWPCAANNSLLHWPATPKAGYFGAQAACRPVMASARLPKFSWAPGENFSLELYLLNDSPAAIPAGTITATLEIGDRMLPLGQWPHPAAAADQHLVGPTYAVSLPADLHADRITVRLTVEAYPECDSTYILHYRSSDVMRPAGDSGVPSTNV
jgi:beta-mannosidase